MRQDLFEPLRLDPYGTSQKLAAGAKSTDPNLKLCMPKGMDLIPADSRVHSSQLRLQLSPFYAAANRRVFGFVTDLLRSDRMNTSSPLMVTDVVKLPFVYWATIRQPKSWTYVRIIAFSSQSDTAIPQAIAIGDPITGVVTKRAPNTKQLI